MFGSISVQAEHSKPLSWSGTYDWNLGRVRYLALFHHLLIRYVLAPLEAINAEINAYFNADNVA